MHDMKGIFFLYVSVIFSQLLSSTFKHNTVMIWVTENGSGLTLGWSGTHQFTSSSRSSLKEFLVFSKLWGPGGSQVHN